MGATFTVGRITLKRMLIALGMSERSVDELLAELNKTHRHANAVAFANSLQRLGLKHEDMVNVLRRIGIDDITISSIFNVVDEERIKSAYGRVVEIFIQ